MAENFQAAETSAQQLKSLPNTSERQISSDLSRRPQFINPFLIACRCKNQKWAAIGMSCLHRLAASQALPKFRINEVIDAIAECTSLGLDILLKILQTLPALLQNYSGQVNGQTFFTLVQICSTLQASKISPVSSTSAATLQQLFASLYEQLAAEDEKALELPAIADVLVGQEQVRVRTVAYDAYRILQDLCLLIGGQDPRHINFSPTPESALLEFIESIFNAHPHVISNHKEQADLITNLLIPYLIKSFSQSSIFPVVLRVTRILYLLIKNHLDMFASDTETILQCLNQSLDLDVSMPWKRILSMELYREVFTQPALILHIHAKFKSQPGQKPIIPDCLAQFVRLATEKPALLGTGQQSTVPTGPYFQRETPSEQFDANLTVGSAGVSTSPVHGISLHFSFVRTPFIEQLDKAEPPAGPDTYIYSLVLISLNNLADSLAKHVTSLTAPNDKAKNRKTMTGTQDLSDDSTDSHKLSKRVRSTKNKTLTNTLEIEAYPMSDDVKVAADLLEMAWPAILATYSTFFHSALDSENYRALVRALQKYTQIAGLLQMTVPRDAFLTTLGKNAMPTNLSSAFPSGMPSTSASSILSNAKGFLNMENIVNQASSFLPERRRLSLDHEPVLNTRNLLCLRALLNLAIALGSTLGRSWSIVFETLQQTELMFTQTRPTRPASSQTGSWNMISQQIRPEITAVQSAATRLFGSTVDLPNDAFLCVVQTLCTLIHTDSLIKTTLDSPESSGHKRRIASFSGLSVKTGLQEHDFHFTLIKLRELVTLNLERFIKSEDEESGWDVMIEQLINTTTQSSIPSVARLLAIDLIRKVVLDTVTFSIDTDLAEPTKSQNRALQPLKSISSIFQSSMHDETTISAHNITFETLRALLEHSGETLEGGWLHVFDIIASCFESGADIRLISITLGHSAFSSMQLICSDFLSPKLDATLPALIDLLYNFNSQKQDLNIALTTTYLFWNASDFIYGRMSQSSLSQYATKSKNDRTQTDRDCMPTTWLYLLQKLTQLIDDSRHEIRNSSIHTTMRIFDNCGHELSPQAWQLCLRGILLAMVDKDVETYSSINDDPEIDEETTQFLKDKIGTSRVLLEALAKLIASYFEDILKTPDFIQLWTNLFNSFFAYLRLNLHDLTAAVFASLDVILKKVTSDLPDEAIKKVVSLWDLQPPISASRFRSSNIAAYEAYATGFASIYKLRENSLTKHDIERIVNNLESCLLGSESPSYSSDLDSLTILQKRVMECISILRTDIEGSTSIIVDTLARFMTLPFKVFENQPAALTYIALSKSSMGVLEGFCSDITWSEVFEHDSFNTVLSSLQRMINLKYQWSQQGRNPPLWKRATSASLVILEQLIPKMVELKIDQIKARKYWDLIVQITHSIAHADALEESTPGSLEDERFDIDSLRKMTTLIVPALGTPMLPDSIPRIYAKSLFTASLIHYSDPLGCLQLDTAPFASLYTFRRGRTLDPKPAPRREMAYFTFRSLIGLVTKQDSSLAQIRLAKAAAPYVILRIALTLHAYIADQPLRGRMPLPASLHKELVTVLAEFALIRCEPAAISPVKHDETAAQGAHLARLFPLIVKAAAIDNGPKELRIEFTRWLDMLGAELSPDQDRSSKEFCF